MGNTIEQNIKVKEIFDVSEALKGIKQIQDALSKLELDPNLKASFNNLFQNMENQAKKASAAAASGFKNKGDVTAYTRAMDQIVDSYDRIISKIELLKADGTLTLNIDTSEFKQVNARINELKKNLDGLDDKMSRSLSTIDKIESRRGTNGTIKSVGSWQTAIEEFKNGNMQKATAALRVLKGLMTKASNNGVDFEKDKTWKAFKKDYDELAKAIKDYNTANQQYEQDSSELAAKDKRRQEILEDTNKLLEQTEELTKKSGQSARQYAIETEKAANDTQKLNSELDHFKSKAAYFFGISNAINLFKRAVRSAYNTVKDLDAVMTETAVVTNFSVGDMWSQLPEYTERANELGVTIHDTYEAATLFYQQGLKTNEVMQISNETLKMARIAGLDAATASDRMTNALRGFNMELDKASAQRVNDVYSKLAAITASNTDEISTAMTKVASLAHNANMEFETTAAFLAQIIESTRESAETAGTALKTVVARFSEVKKLYTKGELLGQDEEGEEIDVNKVSTALRSAGINLNEYLTGAKGLDDIFIELAEKWDSLDQVQQRYIATMAAGSRQQSRFIALMSDYKRTAELVEAANNANGASQQQYEKTLESLQTKLARLKNAWNEFILGLANSDAIKKAVDLLTGLITAINDLIKLISGKNSGVKMIATFFTAFTAFKVGRGIIGRNSGLSNFFGRLVGDSQILAKGSAIDIAKGFYDTLATKIANPPSNNKISTNGLFNYFKMPKLDDYFISNTSNMQGVLWDKLDTTLSTKEQFAELWHTVEKGNLTVRELNQVLEKSGQTFRVTGKNASELGINLNKDAVIMRATSAAAIALGGALMTIGSAMEQQEGPMKDWGNIIKALGIGLTTFGTIMSVYLPLQARLMAEGVTSAIVSIPVVGWIVGIISALIALGVAIYNFAKNNSAEAKLEKSMEAAKAAANAADEAREAYEKLGEAWDSLDEKQQAIDNATKGTREWRDAVKELNTEILELMNLYDGIEIERDENGVISITPESKEAVENKVKNDEIVADAYARISKIREYEDEIAERKAQIIVPNEYYGTPYEKSVGNPYHILLSEYENNLDAFNGMDDDDIIALLKEKEYEATDGIGIYNYDYDKAVAKIRNYVKEYENDIAAIESEKTALGSIFLENAEIDPDLQKYANTLLTNDYIGFLVESNKGKYTNSMSDLRTKYAERFGQGKSWNALVKEDPDLKKYTKEQLQDYLATDDALKQTNEQLKIFTNNIENFTEEEKAFMAASEGGALTLDQIAKLRDGDWTKYFTDFGGEEGFGNQANFDKWFEDALNIAFNNFDTTQYGEKFNNILDESFKFIVKDFDATTYKTLFDNLFSIYSVSGEEGLNKVKHSFLRIVNELEPDEVDDFVKSINNLDWASVNSLEELDALAEEFGISEEAMKGFKNQVIELGNAAANIDLEKFGSVIGIIKKIQSGEQGRSFSEEDYNNLILNGVSEKDFKYNLQTNSYDYIGQSLDNIVTDVENFFQTKANQLEREVASNEAVERIQKRGKLPTDENDAEQVKDFLTYYNNLAGGNSFVSKDFIQTANEDEILAKYNEIMDTFAQKTDIQNTLDQAYAYNLQTKTGADLAALANAGDEDAINTLKQQIVNSGLSQAIIDALLEDVESGEEEKITAAGGVMDTISASNQYGISTEDLEAYVTALRTVDELQEANEATLYGLALANANYQQGFKSVIESYEEWIELKQEDGSIRAEDGNEEQLKAFDKLKKDLKQMFNLTEDVSDEFFKSAENVELLEAAVNGDTEAVSKLRAELAKTKIDLVINDENVKNQVYALFDDIISEAGTLEFGASLDMAPAMQALQQLLEASGVTVSEMAEIFESFGWTPEVTEKAVPFTSFQQMRTQGYQEVVDPVTHETIPIPTEGEDHYVQDGMILVPVFGGATFTPPEIPSFSPSTSSGGGGGGSEKKPSYWKNPYDELYNLQEKINEALRTREALERRYQKLLKQEQATLSDIRKAYYDQIEHLGTEAELQKQLAEGRLRQIKKLGNELYTDEDGDRVSYKDMGVTKYASYNEKTGLIQIDWDALEEIANDSDRTEEGKAAEEYISKLEELVSSYEEVRDKLWEIEDTIEQLREDAIQSYISFEDRVMDALINQYQKQIDSYQSMSDALEEANNEVLDSLREQIDLSRQIRDNTEKEQDIADMENRLAYLQRDTSGANDLEILKLQKNLDDARQSYTDTLIDQAISNMEKDASLAAEQRTKQIQIMQAQLDMAVANGTLWKEVHDIINDAADENGALSPQSNLIKLLEESEGYKSLSAIGKEDWLQKAAEEFHKAWVGLNEAEDKFKVDANSDGTIYDTSTPTEDTSSNNNKLRWDTTEKRKRRGDGKHKWSAFKTGGLADYTGPAWLDGTKTNPELILNAQDSANFIALKDILASLLNIQGANGKVGKGGDNYFDIDISATLESDYDVDKLTEKIKRDIYNDGQYRNVNTINYLR